jgi:DNA-binding transcriptional LysR family regulator
MLDSESEQIRTFVVVAEERSIERASKRLHMAREVVDKELVLLEVRLGVELFDRSQTPLLLTAEGRELLSDGREVLTALAKMRDSARRIASSQLPKTRVVVDEICPSAQIAHAALSLRTRFPNSQTNVQITTIGSGLDEVLGGKVKFGIVATRSLPPAGFVGEAIGSIAYSFVVAPEHPLARMSRPIERAELERHTHLAALNPTELDIGDTLRIAPSCRWRLEKIESKRALLIGGHGWGGMPRETVSEDIRARRLVELNVREVAAAQISLPVWAVHRADQSSTAEDLWFIDQMRTLTPGAGG